MNWNYFAAPFFAALFIAAGLIFSLYPQIDLNVSGYFWTKASGFYLEDSTLPWFLFKVIPLIAYGVGILVGLVFVLRTAMPSGILGIDQRGASFLLSALILGPGLVTNGLLKGFWGRARPVQIVEFGGTAHFTPALEITNQCADNCSFVAGHPSMAFFTIAFAFLLKGRRNRLTAGIAAISFGCLAGFGRIVQGGHFLSDVVFSGLINGGIVWFLYYWIVQRDTFANFLPPAKPL